MYHRHVHLEPTRRWMRANSLAIPRSDAPAEFFAKTGLVEPAHWQLDRIAQLLHEVHQEQRAQGVDQVDLRVSPRRFIGREVSLDRILRHLARVAEGMSRPGMTLVLTLNRDSSPDYLRLLLDAVARGLPRPWTAIDLAGFESGSQPNLEMIRDLYESAGAHGLARLVHAGEFGGEEYVWSALDELGAHRIGHGLPVSTSKALLHRVIADGIHIESCLSSNALLGAHRDLSTHPILMFREEGVSFSINVDLPVLTQRTLSQERQLAAKLLRCSPAELAT